MKNYKKNIRRRSFKKTVILTEVVNTMIRPFKELPSLIDGENELAGCLNAYDLFSFYTADIIKKDIVFVR